MQQRPFTFAVVNVGCGARSMDRVAVVERGGRLAVALADGAGGTAWGDLAAQAALTSLDVAEVPSWIATDGLSAAARLDALDQRLARGPHGGQSTIVLLGVSEGRLAGASVGDSGAWCGDARSTIDLTRAQHRKPLLGSGGAAAVAFSAVLGPGRLLVASDGLFQYASINDIWDVAMAGTVEEAVTQLVELVRLPRRSLRDDVSIALVSYAEGPMP